VAFDELTVCFRDRVVFKQYFCKTCKRFRIKMYRPTDMTGETHRSANVKGHR